jgi:hypothetical protein
VPFLDQPDDDVVRDPLAEVVSSEVKVVARVHDPTKIASTPM